MHKRASAAIAAAGVLLIVCALAANQAWLDRHFLPSFVVPRFWYVRIETSVRLAAAALGVALLLAARTVAARLTARSPLAALQVIAAVALALGASELVLRLVRLRPVEWRAVEEEPRRRPDPRLGWTFAPERTAYNVSGGRTIEYVFDAAGYRVRRPDQPVDPQRPAVLFVGESVILGDGLTYEESVPAQVEAMLGVPGVNMGVYGFSSDQMYLRLQTELPRFRHPVAVVALFMTTLFGRNLDDDRPHLGPGLVWRPAETHARIAALAGLLVPFRRESAVEQGIAVTRDVLRAIVSLARGRGATPLIVVPQMGPEAEPERLLRQRILGDGVPYVLIEIDPAWRIPGDRHPDARAAHLIASAIAARLDAAKSSPAASFSSKFPAGSFFQHRPSRIGLTSVRTRSSTPPRHRTEGLKAQGE